MRPAFALPAALLAVGVAQGVGAKPAAGESVAAHAAEHAGNALPIGSVSTDLKSSPQPLTAESLLNYAADQPGNALPTGADAVVPKSEREFTANRSRERAAGESAAVSAAGRPGNALPIGWTAPDADRS